MKKHLSSLVVILLFLSILSLTSCAANKEMEVEEKEELRTDFIGDNSKVIDIASNLPYPEGVSYDSVEIQSDSEPYELKVFLKLGGEESVDMEESAREAFDRIGNMGIISFYNRENNALIGSFERD